jgi:hypothetical protein
MLTDVIDLWCQTQKELRNISVEYWRSAPATESDPLPEHPMERPMPAEEEAQVEALEEEKDEADHQQNSDTKDRK